MTSPINEIPQNPHPYQKDNFAFAKVMDPITTDLQELPADPQLEEGLLPHLVAEYRFARFQDPLLKGTNKFHLPMDIQMFKTYGAEVPIMGNHQVRGLPTLEGRELQTAHHVVFPFQIRPCETRVRSLQMINSFMYRKETIAAAYEGAGWAFPVETYRDTPHARVHFQGFEILRCMHFPPTLVPSQVLAESLEPNWLPPAEVMADEWGFVKRTEAPYLAEWNEAFDSHHHSLFQRDPAYKSQRRLQRLFKSAQTQNELDAIYEGLKERPNGRRNGRAAQEGERLRRILKHH
jgi:hypothetical protein